ncbi:four-helix bundle copper-binding protein [Bacillus sp. BHET2]|uniref:four-helix bundle copper-binding protein n=1 Tax=Bacillus sp. BHET2 TaxID=2583818 RepID=UPI00110D9434|nr:four-helix bundle copper-binding protein [Bacillus sp. BHET2]TMU87538.1 four-helix bundle copper-binding protein [Bacillus sp. BHET2]
MSQENFQTTIQTLHECMEACNHCFDKCLKEENIGMMVGCILMDSECADMCGFLEQALVRGTPFVAEIATACAAICEACDKECERHDHDHCQKCAKACFACADECRNLA